MINNLLFVSLIWLKKYKNAPMAEFWSLFSSLLQMAIFFVASGNRNIIKVEIFSIVLQLFSENVLPEILIQNCNFFNLFCWSHSPRVS